MIDRERVAWLRRAIEEGGADVVVNPTACRNALRDASRNNTSFVTQATEAVERYVAEHLRRLAGVEPAGVTPAAFAGMVAEIVDAGWTEPVARQVVAEWAAALDVELLPGDTRSLRDLLGDSASSEDEIVAVLTDPDVVVHADPDVLLPALLRLRHRDEELLPLLARAAYLFPLLAPAERPALLGLVARQEGLPWSEPSRAGAGWAVDWVRWRPSSPHIALGHGRWGRIVALSPDGEVVAMTMHQDIRTWHLLSEDPGEQERDPCHLGTITAAAFSWDHGRLVTGSDDGTAVLWDVGSGEGRALGPHDAAVRAVAFTPDGRHVVTGSVIGDGRVFDVATGRPVDGWGWGWLGAIRHIAAAADGATIAVASDTSSAVLGDWRNQARNGALGTTRPVVQLASNPARAQVGLVGERRAELWELGDGATGTPRALAPPGPPADALGFADDGASVALAGDDGVVRLYGTVAGETRGRVGELATPCRYLAVSRPLAGIVTVDDLDLVQVWSLTADAVVRRAGDVVGRIGDVALVGRDRVAVADARPGVRLYRTADGGYLFTLAGTGGAARLVAPSPDGERLLTVGVDGWVREWPIDGPAGRVGRAQPCTADVRGLVFDRSGRVVTVGADGIVRLWKDMPFDGPVQELFRAPASLSCVAVSGGGLAGVVGTEDGCVHYAGFDSDGGWTVVDEHRVGTPVSAVALSPGATWGASVGEGDRRVDLWGSDGAPLAELPDHGSGVASIAFSPGGRLVATGCRDGVVRVFAVHAYLEENRRPGSVERVSCIPVRSPVVKVVWVTDDQLLVGASSGLVSVRFSSASR